MKKWDPTWASLPPVEPVDRSGPPPSGDSVLERQPYARRQYERTHLRHVLEAEAKRQGEADDA